MSEKTTYEMTRYKHYHDGEPVALRDDEEIVHTHENDDGTLTFWTRRAHEMGEADREEFIDELNDLLGDHGGINGP